MNFLTLFSYNISVSSLLKIIFIIFLSLITIFLIYQELKIIDEKQTLIQKPVMESSSKVFKTFKEIVVVFIPVMLGYKTYWDGHKNNRITDTDVAHFLKIKSEYEKLLTSTKENDMISGTKYISNHASYFSNFSDLHEKFQELKRLKDKERKILNELQKINELKIKKEQGVLLSHEESSLINREDLIKSSLDITQFQYGMSSNTIDDKFKSILDIDKSSILNYEKLEEFLKTLTPDEILAFSGLLLNQLILSHVISIILILYGDYLIKRFNLENKFPKLARFIQLRRKLQSYYLKLSFTWIILAILPQIFMYSSIILSKLIELFN